MNGQLTVEEFVLGSENLIKSAAIFNETSRDTIDMRLCRISSDTAYSMTASVYLEISQTVQVFYSSAFQTPVFYLIDYSLTDVQPTGFGRAKFSFIEHPVTGFPCCYLHPCQTAKVMSEQGYGNPTEYLFKWLGIYGNDLPIKLPMGFFNCKDK